jgi:hypothetical protein
MDVLLVPDSAVVSDQTRKILFAVGANNKVVAKPVTLGPIALGLRAITAGLAPDDNVIIGGLANPFVRPGAAVKPTPGEIKQVEAKRLAVGAEHFTDYRSQLLPWSEYESRLPAYCTGLGIPERGVDFAAELKAN